MEQPLTNPVVIVDYDPLSPRNLKPSARGSQTYVTA